MIVMKRKVAVITVELVDESILQADSEIEKEMLAWFSEEVAIPWFKSVKGITVKDC